MFRHILIKLIFLVCFGVQIKAQINDSFSDGNFSANPSWIGDTSAWKVIGGQLNSNVVAPATQAYLSTSSSLASNVQWEFYVELKFATSSLNYADIFLISDSSNLQGVNSGIFVRIGNTADEISLYRKDGAVSTKIIDGTDGRVGSISSNIFSIKVTRSANNEFKLYYDATGSGSSYLLEGSIIENNYTSSRYFGFNIKCSSSNVQKFFFDNVVVGPFIPDTIKPKIDSVWADDSVHCIVRFNEAIDTNSGFNKSNFLLNNSLLPSKCSINGLNARELVLEFASPFIDGQLNDLLLKNITDLSGNNAPDTVVNFAHYNLYPGDIVVNEIFADPSPPVGLPPYEFIELWNVSGKDINLQGFQITDGSSAATFPSLKLPKDSFLIVSSAAALNSFVGYGRAVYLSGFPGLNNDGDRLQLFNKKNQILDEVTYAISWYGNEIKNDGGWSLEMKHPRARCQGEYNWKASINNSGGTPGSINSIYEAGYDTLSPTSKFSLINDSSAWLVFSAVMDSNSLGNMVFTGLTNLSTQVVKNGKTDSLLLHFDRLQNQITYQLKCSSMRSCNGHLMKPLFQSFTYDQIFEVKFKDVLFSELLINAGTQTALPNSQYIELVNKGMHSINLKGMKISDGTTTALLPNYKLMKDSFVVIAPFTKLLEFNSRGIRCLGVSNFPYLNSESDNLVLTDSVGEIIHVANYNTKQVMNVLKASGGWSLENTSTDNPCCLNRQWQFSEHVSGGTPGLPNSLSIKIMDDQPLKYMRAYTIGGSAMVLHFNKGVDLQASRSKIQLACKPIINATFQVSYYNNHLNEVMVSFKNNVFVPSQIFEITLGGLLDCGGNNIIETKFKIGLPSMPVYGDIAINEILFNARAYGSEFVELYNTSDKIFDLKTLTLNITDKNGNPKGAFEASSFPFQLLPSQYISVAADAENICASYLVKDPSKVLSNTEWITLDDDSGFIVLADLNTLSAVDTVYYSKQWHHAYISNDEGVSLERINFFSDGSQRNQWLSAASSAGYATPGYQNSKFEAPVTTDDFVWLTSGYFTPDNDGLADEVKIKITLPAADFAINIDVFDLNGNLIYQVARNDISATDNNYIWDGRNNSGQLACIGHYILLITATDNRGQTRSSKKVVDLLLK